MDRTLRFLEAMAIRATIRSTVDAWRYLRRHGLWHSLRAKDAPWVIQFGKYGLCGVMATVLHNVLFFVISAGPIPALDHFELENSVRARNIVINNLIAFAVSNTFVYFANLLIVFTGGRHHRVLEFLYFTTVNLVAMTPGLVLAWLTAKGGTETPYAQLIFIICSILMNFVCRKFLVFKG